MTQDSQFPGGATRLQKLFHWSMVGAAPKSEGPLTRGFCRAGNIGVNIVMVPATFGAIMANQIAGRDVFKLGLDD